MKFNKKLISLIIIFIFILSSTISFAEYDLYVSNWNIETTLLDNGDIHVVEDISYKFNSHYNGIFKNISLNKTDGIEDIKIEELKDNPISYKQVADAENGDENVFIETIEKDKTNIKIYSPSDNETKTFRLSYTLKNVAIKYNDISELYYIFIDEENSTFIKNLDIKIILPENINDMVKIFAHGPSNGNINFNDDRSIVLNVKNVETETMVESRILFPVSFIPNSNNIINEDKFNEIMAEEESYIIKNEELEKERIENAKKEELQLIKYIKTANIISPIILAIGALLGFTSLKKSKVNTEDYEKELGEDMLYLPPAINSYLLNSALDNNTFVASIYHLAYKGYISIEEDITLNKKFIKKEIENFKLTDLKKDRDGLLSHEIFLLEWFFNGIVNSDTITTEEIYEYNKNHPFKYSEYFSQFSKKVSNDFKELGLKDSSQKGFGILLIILSNIFLPLGLFNLIAAKNYLFGFISLVFMIFLFIMGIVLISKRTALAKTQSNKLKQFKKDIKNGHLDIKEEEYLITAMAVGVPMDNLIKFKTNFTDDILINNNWIYWYFLMNSRGDNIFASSVNYSGNYNSSSSTGSGGGFSSGGGGGAGGGSTGGF